MLAYFNQIHNDKFDKFSKQYGVILLTVGCGIYFCMYLHKFLGYPNLDKLFYVIAFSFILIFAVSTDETKKNMTVKGCYYISTRSYSMYLLHPEALALVGKFKEYLPVWGFALCALAITLLISEILYRYVEVVFMDMRERFSSTRSTFKAV